MKASVDLSDHESLQLVASLFSSASAKSNGVMHQKCWAMEQSRTIGVEVDASSSAGRKLAEAVKTKHQDMRVHLWIFTPDGVTSNISILTSKRSAAACKHFTAEQTPRRFT